jgi:signal peptidase II
MLTILLPALALFFLDLAVKNQVDRKGKNGTLTSSACHGFFQIHRVENPGMILGLGKKSPGLVKWLPLIVFLCISLLLFPWLLDCPSFLPRFGFGLLLGGGLNNIYDHWKRGFVIDYFSFPIKKIRNLYFNLSDFGIFFGTILTCLFLG